MSPWLIVALIVADLVLTLAILNYFVPGPTARLGVALERRRAGFTLAQIEVDGATVAYLRGGRGQPVLLIHGFGADKDNFTRLARHLTRYFDVIAIDLPGFGDSTRLPDAPYDIEAQCSRLATIIDALGLKRFHLGGNSMGGALAMAYATRQPQRIRTLWLLNPAGVDGAQDSEMVAAYRRDGTTMLVATTVDEFRAVIELGTARWPKLPHCVVHALGTRAVADEPLHRRIFDEIAHSPGYQDRVTGLALPTLIVWGDQDRVLDVSGAHLLHAAFPNSELEIMKGIGHLPMIEAPAATAARFLEFVGAHRDSVPALDAASETAR